MDFAESQGATIIVRGLRAVADFEYEFQMAGMNQQLNDRVETVFLMADVALQPIASRLVKEIAVYGGNISRFVPQRIAADGAKRLSETKGRYRSAARKRRPDLPLQPAAQRVNQGETVLALGRIHL